MTVPRHGSQRGQSLVELMLVVALIGVTVVAFTPFQTFLMRRLNDNDPAERSAALSWTARHLASDARSALDTHVESPSSVRFSLPGDRAVTWTGKPGGVVRRIDRTGQRESVRELPVAAFGVAVQRGNLFAATLTDAAGQTRRVEIWLRHEGRR